MSSRWVTLALCCPLVGCGGDESSTSWTVLGESRPAALLSVWASGPDDVWVVGGDPRDGGGPLVDHYDGVAWTRVDSGVRDVDLWWVYGFAGGPVFASGTDGTLLRYRAGAFERLSTPSTRTVFGMWGESAEDLWLVGGNFGGGAFTWRFDGTAIAEQTLPQDLVDQGTVWKVGGRATDDIWMSASNGAILHWDGSSLSRTNLGVDAPLLSVAGNAKRFVAVGGQFDGVLYENDGGGWMSKLPVGGPSLNGVAVSMQGDDAYAVGQYGTVLHREGTWVSQKSVTTEHLHAAFIDPTGGTWAVGGQFGASPTKEGVLIYHGNATIAPLP